MDRSTAAPGGIRTERTRQPETASVARRALARAEASVQRGTHCARRGFIRDRRFEARYRDALDDCPERRSAFLARDEIPSAARIVAQARPQRNHGLAGR